MLIVSALLASEDKYFRFSSLDKQDKGYLSREDFLRIPELAINPLGDRIVHAFFFESRSQEEEKVDFKDFVRVLAHFRPIKKNAEKNKLNTRMEKLHFAFRLNLVLQNRMDVTSSF